MLDPIDHNKFKKYPMIGKVFDEDSSPSINNVKNIHSLSPTNVSG